jgi:hypothetical protein
VVIGCGEEVEAGVPHVTVAAVGPALLEDTLEIPPDEASGDPVDVLCPAVLVAVVLDDVSDPLEEAGTQHLKLSGSVQKPLKE